MKKTVLVIVMLTMLKVFGFAQSATINGTVCTNSTDCPTYVCANSTVSLVAGITSGSIDSVKWRERIWNGSTWSAWTTISSTTTQSVPFSEPATLGHAYRYQLIVYVGVNQYFALADLYVNAAPTATLLSNYTTICAGTAVSFTASAGGTNYDFKVNGISKQSSLSSTFSSTLANGDNVNVTISNAGGCTTTSTPISITVHPTPSVTSVSGNPAPGCVGNNGIVTLTGLSGTAPWSFEVWTSVGGTPGTLYYTVPGTTATPNTTLSVPIPAVGNTSFYLKITDAFGCKNF